MVFIVYSDDILVLLFYYCAIYGQTDDTFDAFFILPPLGGSVQVLKDYIKACERKEHKFVITFEYVWIFVDRHTPERP